MQDAPASVIEALAGLLSIVAIFIVPRLSLALPGKALGRDDITLGVAWRVSKHNTWRMVWAYFFCILPWGAIAGGISYWLYRSDYSQATITLVMIVIGLLGIAVNMLSVGMLSPAYRHFLEGTAWAQQASPARIEILEVRGTRGRSLQPRRCIATEHRRRAIPARRRLRKLHSRAEMAQRSALGMAFDAHPVELLRREVEIGHNVIQLALAIDHHAGPAERDAYMIAAAFACAARERQ